MSTITTRSGKGSPLTNNEVDANFTNLNTDKLESADLAGYATLSGATFTGEVEATGFNGDLTGAILFKGQAGEALTKGDPVYISGISGNKTVVSKADANDANKMPCFGIVDATVSANADCSVVTFGTLQGLDTSSFSEGDELFVSDTGTLTTTAPTGESSQIQKIGKVTRSHASTGSIKVMGAGRTNAVPNLNDGQFFLGNGSNQAVSTDFTTSVLGEISAGTGIGISASGVISNSAPDQTVSLTGGTGISTSGTYPNFTITNDSPDQTVSLTGAGTTTVSGTYPNFTITGAGTTYTAGTGITLTGTEFSLTDTNAKLNVSDYTAADVLTKIKTVDGSGSGLDADTVDGIQASSFLRSDAVDTATGNMTFDGVVNLNNTVNFNPNGYQIVMDTDQTRKLFDFYRNGSLRMSLRHQTNQDDFNFDFTSGSNLKINDNRILTTADEGSGNGLDADTVDSIEASSFLRSDAADTAANRITFTDGISLEPNDGIRFGGTADIHLRALTNNANSAIDLSGGSLSIGGVANTVWHAGNDGSGSGLDADTVDGVHASAIMQEFGSTTADLDTLTASGAYRIQNSNANRPANYGQLLTVHGGSDTIGQIYFDYQDGNIKTRAGNPSDVGGSGSWSAWRTVWTDENDGSGSGLDADLLDGLQTKTSSGTTGANQILRSHSNNYFYHGSWIWVNNGGIFANTNNAHFTPNSTTSYGSWKTSGSKGGYDGIVFDSGGDVAIMYDSSGNGGLYRQANGRWHIYHHVGNNCLAIGGSTTSSAYEAYVHGDLYATGNITAYSDARIKENVETIDSALDKVESMRGVYYNKIDDPDKTKEVGFIAQEVNEVIPEAVTYAEDVDQYGVKYANITALLVESVKELSQQVKDLQAEVKELKENV